MSDPYVLTILVTSGDPEGVRVVEKSNWSGQGVVLGVPISVLLTVTASHHLGFTCSLVRTLMARSTNGSMSVRVKRSGSG